MTLFLDAGVLLAAVGSDVGASRYVIEHHQDHGWQLLSSGYCIQETLRNLSRLGEEAHIVWSRLIKPPIAIVPDVVALDKLLVFPKEKDRPVIVSALAAKSSALLTLDRADFQRVLGSQVYGMAVRTPSAFLIEQRKQGRL